MYNYEYSTTIAKPLPQVWDAMWGPNNHPIWTAAFAPASYVVTTFEIGSPFNWLDANGNGFYGQIKNIVPLQMVHLEYNGEIKAYQKQNNTAATWANINEIYSLETNNESTQVKIKITIGESYFDYIHNAVPKALAILKLKVERNLISVVTTINATIENIWHAFNTPSCIMQWNHASPDWHTPQAINNLQVGENFNYTMAAKNGSFAFNFEGTYTEIVTHKLINYTLADNRLVKILFIKMQTGVKIIQCFEPEKVNSPQMQQTGWQAILNNFKLFVEAN